MMNKNHKQTGAVSIFVVVFSALLIIIITISFIRIMLQGQQQATLNDLSKSALDSAYAGVEDAKRVIHEYYKLSCDIMSPRIGRCAVLDRELNNPESAGSLWTDCDRVKVLLGKTAGQEVPVIIGSADDKLNQAYTCVKIQMEPKDYRGTLKQSESRMIRLQPASGTVDDVKRIRLQWYSKQPGLSSINLTGLLNGQTYNLPRVWPSTRPPILRVQLLQYGDNFQMDNFDSSSSYNATLFLLPSNRTLDARFVTDTRRNGSQADKEVKCDLNIPGTYVCDVGIELPFISGGSGSLITKKGAYLNITQYYSSLNSDFRLTMLNASGDEIPFGNVQSVVDSTGRANDNFRRIQSRIDIGWTTVPIPVAVDVTKSLCKDFKIVDGDPQVGEQLASVCPLPQY